MAKAVSRSRGNARVIREDHSDQGVTRDRITAAASQLFRVQGYEKTSMAAIAKAVGVTPPALYWHFDSKADILFEFLHSTLDAFTATVEEQLGDVDDPIERLRAFAKVHTRTQLEANDRAHAYGELMFATAQLSQSLDAEHLEELNALQRRYYGLCRDIIIEGINAEVLQVANVAAATFAIINFCEYVTTWFDREGPLSIEEIADLHGEFAVRLVGGPAS